MGTPDQLVRCDGCDRAYFPDSWADWNERCPACGGVPVDRPVAAWNVAHPVGTPVRYWPAFREGEGIATVTRSRAFVLGGHTPVVWVEGRDDCIALTHVEATSGE